MSDRTDPLRDAFSALRERHDGTHAESDATLRQALLLTRKKRDRERNLVRYVLPAAAVLVASTAWAGANGRLAAAIHVVEEALHADREVTSPSPSPSARPTGMGSVGAASPTPSASVEPAATEVPPPAPETVAQAPSLKPDTDAPVAAITPPPVHAAPSSTQTTSHAASSFPSKATQDEPTPARAPEKPAASAVAEDPNAALFAEAHRQHFVARDAAKALTAWDAYLAAAPNGRFVPEARYNRAITLVRLGRSTEAREELRAFASGTYGDYRRDEARALLEALARDE